MGFITSLPMAKDTEMVKRFFSSLSRLFFLTVVCAVAVWGVVQVFMALPYAGEVNKWIVFSFSCVMLWSFKEIGYDYAYWFRCMKKALNQEVDVTKE